MATNDLVDLGRKAANYTDDQLDMVEENRAYRLLIHTLEALDDRSARYYACDCVEHIIKLAGDTAQVCHHTISVVRHFACGDATSGQLATAWGAASDAAYAAGKYKDSLAWIPFDQPALPLCRAELATLAMTTRANTAMARIAHRPLTRKVSGVSSIAAYHAARAAACLACEPARYAQAAVEATMEAAEVAGSMGDIPYQTERRWQNDHLTTLDAPEVDAICDICDE